MYIGRERERERGRERDVFNCLDGCPEYKYTI